MITIIKNGQITSSSGDVSQYNGDKTGGEFAHWKLFGTDPSKFVQETYGILSSRCATLYHTAAIARACVNKPLTYSIGKGIVFKSLPDFNYLDMDEEEARQWGRKFTKLLHYEKQEVKWYKKQKQLAKEAKITGDAVMYFIREFEKTGIPFDIAVTQGSVIDWEKTEDSCTLGIYHDMYGRRTGFHHKDTQKVVQFRDGGGNQIAIQFLFPDRAGQLRGFSIFSSEIARAKNLDRVWDAVIERMVMEAIQVGYFNASNTDIAAQAKAMARQSSGRAQSPEELSMKPVGNATPQKPGGMYVLENEESMTFTDMKAPSDNFGMANEWTVNLFGMATGIAPEVILGKYATSYTAHKGAFNDFLKIVDEDRASFIDSVESSVNFEYLKHFIRTGQIEVSPEFWTDHKVRAAYMSGTYLGPVPGHINPLQEVKADALSVAEGFTLRSSIASKHENDFWNMIDSWEEEQTRWYEASPDKRAEALFQAEKAAALVASAQGTEEDPLGEKTPLKQPAPEVQNNKQRARRRGTKNGN